MTISHQPYEELWDANAAYGRLRKRVFENNNVRSNAELMAHRAAVSSSMECLQQTPQGTGAVSSTLPVIPLGRKGGHIVCMTNARLPEQELYSQFRNGRQAPSGQRKHFSDPLKASLAMCSIPTDTWESLAQDRPKWRRKIGEDIEHLKTCHWENMDARRKQKDISKLEIVQKRFARVLPGMEDLSYKERTDRLGLLLLERRRLRGDLIEVYKIMRGIEKVNSRCLFPR
eukprot:g44798.t1